MGKEPFDLAVRNTRLVNVFSGEVYPADIGVKDGVFAYAGAFGPEHSAAETVDAGGMFAVPGFLDSH
jgi:adenine deaminase